MRLLDEAHVVLDHLAVGDDHCTDYYCVSQQHPSDSNHHSTPTMHQYDMRVSFFQQQQHCLEVSHDNVALTRPQSAEIKLDVDYYCSPNDAYRVYSAAEESLSAGSMMSFSCPFEDTSISACSSYHDEQQQETISLVDSSDWSISSNEENIFPCRSMVRGNSLAGNPLPDAMTSCHAPPPTTLCPHALSHKFPDRYGHSESNEEFLIHCLRHTSLDLVSRPFYEKMNRQHSLAGHSLPGAYLDKPFDNIECFEEQDEELSFVYHHQDRKSVV